MNGKHPDRIYAANPEEGMTPTEWICGFAWHGHCLLATMQVLCDTCGITPEDFLRKDSPEGACNITRTTYLKFREGRGASSAKGMLSFFSYLALNAGSIAETARWLIRVSGREEGLRGDSIRLALEHDTAVFEVWMFHPTGLDRAATQGLRMLNEKTYDMDFLRLAREVDKKILDWYVGGDG